MFDDDNEYIDYDRLVDDADDLLDEDYYSDDEYDYDLENEREFDCYYHNVADELIDD